MERIYAMVAYREQSSGDNISRTTSHQAAASSGGGGKRKGLPIWYIQMSIMTHSVESGKIIIAPLVLSPRDYVLDVPPEQV